MYRRRSRYGFEHNGVSCFSLISSIIEYFSLICFVFKCSQDSPVLWIRLDPEMTLIRAVDTKQPDFQWQYQLRHERDVTAQMEAIWALEA